MSSSHTMGAAAPAIRKSFLPYCLPMIGEEEINEVVDSLRSGWVTTGPKVKRFEEDMASYIGARHTIAVNSCTAALHIALTALEIGPGDDVLVPTLTFCSTANVVLHLGARPVLVDVDQNGHICLESAEAHITPATRAIIPVHYAGVACDLEAVRGFAERHAIEVVEDAAHAIGCTWKNQRIGASGRAIAFSFYATKNMTTGEGGLIATDDSKLADHMRALSLHGMSRDAWKRYSETGSWYYEVLDPGYKDNMTDLQAAIGIHQLRRLDGFIARRQEIAARYDEAFSRLETFDLPQPLPQRNHIYHLYAIRLRPGALNIDRSEFIDELRRLKIGTSVHFIPLHRHPLFQRVTETAPDRFPNAERFYQGVLSLPLYPKMSDQDVEDTITAVQTVVQQHGVHSRS